MFTSINYNNIDKVAAMKRGKRGTCVGATIYNNELIGAS